MDLERWAVLLSIFEGVLLPLSLLLVWLQLRQQTNLTRAANAQALVELSSPFNLQLIQDREMARLWVSGAASFAEMDEVDQYRFKSLLIWWLILHENIFYQRRKNLIDEEAYRPWLRDLKDFTVRMDLPKHWPGLRSALQKDFAAHMDEVIRPL